MENNSNSKRLDVIALFLAGLINTFLALFDAGIILAPGTESFQPDVLSRLMWISENTLRWQIGWIFWFAVTLSFSWSYYALGRHLKSDAPWINLSIGLAIIAAAVDIVGVLVNMVVLSEIANSGLSQDPITHVLFISMEKFAYALTNVAAFGLYSVAGLLLLPATFSTPDYPRKLQLLGIIEWSIATIATILLIVAPTIATIPLLISFALYAPWVWGSALWIRNKEITI